MRKDSAGRSLSLASFARKLFNNPEIQSLAQAELEATEASQQSTASASRRSVPEPPDLENVKDAKDARRQYAQWIEGRRAAREQQRFAKQEDQVWALAKTYLTASLFIIVLAFVLAR
jgi:hypothetical protein